MAERKIILVVAESQCQARPYNIELGYTGYANVSVTDAGDAVAVIDEVPKRIGGVLMLGVYIPYSGLAEAEVERFGAQRFMKGNIGALAVVDAAEKKGLPVLIDEIGTPDTTRAILKSKTNVTLKKLRSLDDLSLAYRETFH